MHTNNMIDHSFIYPHKKNSLKVELIRLKMTLASYQEQFDSKIHFETGEHFELDDVSDKIKELQDEIVIKEKDLSRSKYAISN